MFGHISLCLDISTHTYHSRIDTSHWNILSSTNYQTVSRQTEKKPKKIDQLNFSSHRLFEPAQIIDIVKGLVLIGCAIPMCFMDISVVYHTVRAQAAIKLYMFFNMLEVCDRLLSSFGQDTLDAVYWTATEPRRRHSAGKLFLWLIIAIIYCSKSMICQRINFDFDRCFI